MEIKLKSKWLEECLCKFLNKEDNILKEEDLIRSFYNHEDQKYKKKVLHSFNQYLK